MVKKTSTATPPKQRELASNSDNFKTVKDHMSSLIPGLDPSPAVVTKFAFTLAVESLKKLGK